MKKNSGKIWLRCSLQAAICFVIFVVFYFLGVFATFENKTYDQRMKFTAGFSPACDEIAFIEVNQYSLDWAKENKGWSWPWPREAYAQIIDFLSAGNVKSIAFDMMYTEPSIYGQEDDEILGRSEAESGKVIQTIFVEEKNGELQAEFPVPQIKDNAALIGNVTSKKDSDDIMRRSRISYTWEGQEYPSLGFAPLFLNDETDKLNNLPVLDEDTVLLRYRESLDSYLPYQACDILESYDAWKVGEEGILSPSDFEDLYVYFALYAPGLFDICSTPVSQVYPGVGVHITALDNYLTDSFMKKAPVSLELLWYFLAAISGAIIICVSLNFKSQRLAIFHMVLGFVMTFALIIGIPFAFFIKNIWLNLFAPLILFTLSFLISLMLGFTQEGKQKRFIKAAFSQCLAKDVVNQILEDPDSFTLGGKKYMMSAIFTDIQKFSSFSELLSASELGALLNYYLTKMSDIIIEERGTVDKYEGDAIVAFVGAPLEMKDHAIHACAAAIKMKNAEQQMNREIVKIGSMDECPAGMDEELFDAFKIMVKNNKTLFTRIGINSGEMIAGYFGSEKKKNYTMMGNNVNLASRLEGVNKQYQTNGIIISQATRELLTDGFIVRSLDKVQVVNVENPIQLYELLDFTNGAIELHKYAGEWEEAMLLFNEKKYTESLTAMKKLLEKKPDDHVLEYYISLLQNFFVQGKYPVARDGIGVEFIPEKSVFRLLNK